MGDPAPGKEPLTGYPDGCKCVWSITSERAYIYIQGGMAGGGDCPVWPHPRYIEFAHRMPVEDRGHPA